MCAGAGAAARVAEAAAAKGGGRLPQLPRNNPRPARVLAIPASRATRGNGEPSLTSCSMLPRLVNQWDNTRCGV